VGIGNDVATDSAQPISPLSSDAEQVAIALEAARAQMLALVAHLDAEDLERVHSPIMSPLVWDLGHIAAYEDLWLAHRHAGLELLRPDLAELYDAFETPRAVRGDVETLGPHDARAYLRDVRARVLQGLARHGVGDGVICEMVVRHELQHAETMRQTLAIAGLLSAHEQAKREGPFDREGQGLQGGSETWVEIPAGPFAMGAGPERFAYDNERPRHTVETPAFAIARHPVSNASWTDFVRDGGYERRAWWSDAGWAWKQEHDAGAHPAVTSGHPQAPVCHVSWFEADAFARARGARLPTEAEWEKAATWTRGTPNGSDPQTQAGALPVEDRRSARDMGALPVEDLSGARDMGALATVGHVWEWTSSRFGGYPGFLAHPYREYSEVFFGADYRVLRGGSWATDPRVAGATFRNWDLPQRRQIFAGLRLAKQAA
jgi:gamma-glutamyl hercynylcysteine S-oxide synthase